MDLQHCAQPFCCEACFQHLAYFPGETPIHLLHRLDITERKSNVLTPRHPQGILGSEYFSEFCWSYTIFQVLLCSSHQSHSWRMALGGTRLCQHIKSKLNTPHTVWIRRWKWSQHNIFLDSCWGVNVISYPRVSRSCCRPKDLCFIWKERQVLKPCVIAFPLEISPNDSNLLPEYASLILILIMFLLGILNW